MKYYQSLKNCHSIYDVVELINNGGTAEADANEIAANYSLTASTEDCSAYGWSLSEKHIEISLDYLAENGAKFNYKAAFQSAMMQFLSEKKD